MSQKNSLFHIALTVVGFGLLVFGLIFVKSSYDTIVPYLSIGIGCGMFGYGLGEVLRQKTGDKYPEIAKQQEIDLSDERNVMLNNRAAAKAYQLMVYVFGALLVAFALMNVELRVILLLVAAYLLVVGCYIYYYSKYNKEM